VRKKQSVTTISGQSSPRRNGSGSPPKSASKNQRASRYQRILSRLGDLDRVIRHTTTRERERDELYANAVEWLRLESLYRAKADTLRHFNQNLVESLKDLKTTERDLMAGKRKHEAKAQAILGEKLKQNGQRIIEQDKTLQGLWAVKERKHDWLIGLGPKPDNWELPFRYRTSRREAAMQILQPGTRVKGDPLRLSFSVDLTQPEKHIQPLIRAALKNAKQSRFNRTRALGSGRKRILARMWESLHIDITLSTRDIGEKAQTFTDLTDEEKRTAAGHDRYEDRGQELLELAREMREAALGVTPDRSTWRDLMYPAM